MDVGTDTLVYHDMYAYFDGDIKWSVSSLLFGDEPIFYFLIFVSSFTDNYKVFFFLVCLLMNVFYYYACILYSKNNNISPLWNYIILLVSFTVWVQQINVIRSGLAISISLVAIYYIFEERYKKALLFSIFAIGCHISIIIFLLIAIVVKIFSSIKIKSFYYFYIVGILLSALGFSLLTLITHVAPEMAIVERYASGNNSDYNTGFRWNFVIFNSLFLLYFYYKRIGININTVIWLKLYIATSVVFFLWFAIPYSDRIGAFSWILIPFLLATCSFKRPKYPLLLFCSYAMINYLI